MKKYLLLLLFPFAASAQEDSVTVDLDDEFLNGSQNAEPEKVFYAQRLINSNTVEVLSKGIMEFRVSHHFGDIAGKNGGMQRFFGLDNATDARIAFQFGLGERLNLVAARTRGGSELQQLWELGLKYQFLRQMQQNAGSPLSVTLYANIVASGMKSNPDPLKETHFESFSDRLSQLLQLMIAKRIGNFSIQITPTYVHTNRVVPGDQEGMFALGGATRIPITKKFFLIADYFHPFRSNESRDLLESQGVNLYDVLGVGIEILTEGHVFHLNFTNATNILENRFIPRTFTTWNKGQYRWGFTVSRRFVLSKN